jgi:hypothetical protein
MRYKNVQWRMTKVHFKLWCTEVEHYLRAITFLIDLIVSINSDYSHAYPLTGKYSIGLLDNKLINSIAEHSSQSSLNFRSCCVPSI